jgi:TM2 domain-containing membrane protein YozV
MAKEKELAHPMPPINAWLPAVALGWLIPGSGHLLLKRRGRGIVLFATIGAMFICGLLMRGAMFTPQSGDLLTTLINTGGFIGDLCSGLFYILTVSVGYSQPDQAGAVHDYGTKFLVTAGLLNLLAITDVYDIAARRKE